MNISVYWFQEMIVNTVTDQITECSFSKVSKFSHIAQSMLLALLQGCFKKADIQFKCNNVLCNEVEEY